MTTHALIPRIISHWKIASWASNLFIISSGVISISLLAQIAVPLPYTPVPITGQTFGVLLIALTFGWWRSFSTTLIYITIGTLGAPVFAAGRGGLSWGPTLGYLIGMLVSSLVVGYVVDRGWTKTPLRCAMAALLNSIFIFSFGLMVLSLFIPKEHLLAAGLWPFIPGDLIKSLLAVGMVQPVQKLLKNI